MTGMKTTSQRTFRRYFNLIEVVLALAVIAIGMLAIIGLIPIGTSATRDAIGQNYAADAADETLQQLSKWLRSDWTTNLALVPTDAALPDVTLPSYGATWVALGSDPKVQVSDGDYPTDPAGGNVGKRVYRFYHESVADPTAMSFEGVIRIWKSPTTAWEIDSAGTWVAREDTSYTKRLQLNLEVSWPASMEYGDRQKMQYALEVVR